MADITDDQVWQRWLEIHPYDADCTPEQRATLLDTYAAHALRLGMAVDALAEPVRTAMRARVDQMDARLRDLQHKALIRALRGGRDD